MDLAFRDQKAGAISLLAEQGMRYWDAGRPFTPIATFTIFLHRLPPVAAESL